MLSRVGMPGRQHRALPVAVLACALALRLYGLNWDGGLLFHPDERQILMVASRLHFPWRDLGALFSVDSPWNPRFFAYGSLPVYGLRVLTALLSPLHAEMAMLQGSSLVGRALSALVDTGTVGLVYLLGRRLYDRWVGLLAAALVTVTVLHVQLAHYYGVDVPLTFFTTLTVMLSVDLVRRPTLGRGMLVGACWGLALATKLSAAALVVPVGGAWLLSGAVGRGWRRGIPRALRGLTTTALAAVAAFVLAEPYAVLDAVRFGGEVAAEAGMAGGLLDRPYTRQYIGTAPYFYPLAQLVVWSLGVPLGVASLTGTALALLQMGRELARGPGAGRAAERIVPLAWVVAYWTATGGLFAKFSRYMLPIVPLLCLYAAWALLALLRAGRRQGGWRAPLTVGLVGVVVSATAAYALAYTAVYRARHPWLRATEWICTHAPAGSTLLVEHWDDALPVLHADGYLDGCPDYQLVTLPMYDEDTPAKRERLLGALRDGDYVVISSQRLYGTIARLPERYPLTSRYYQHLFGERLGYELVHYEATYPELLGVRLVHDPLAHAGLPKPRLLAQLESAGRSLPLSWADESYSVYDHPMPLIFQRVRELSPDELERLLLAPDGGPALK